jgi:hypothetical protein
MSLKQPERDEVFAMIDQAVSAAYARAASIQGVLANHSFQVEPTSTVAILTTATTLAVSTMTAKGPANFRFIYAFAIDALTTTQPVVTPTLSVTIGGADTITAVLPAITMPLTTESPSFGMLSGVIESARMATLASNTSVPWAPTAGSVIVATL